MKISTRGELVPDSPFGPDDELDDVRAELADPFSAYFASFEPDFARPEPRWGGLRCSVTWAQTSPPIPDAVRSAAHIYKAWQPTIGPRIHFVVFVCDRFSSDVLDVSSEVLADSWIEAPTPWPTTWSAEEDSPPWTVAPVGHVAALPSGHTSSPPPPGTPTAVVLVEAVAQLRQWLAMTQTQLASYMDISASTFMAWRRDLPEHPRHPRIPALLNLWSSAASARAELSESDFKKLVWGRVAGGAPAAEPGALAESLLQAATEASDAAFFAGDDYDPETATMPTLEDLEESEAALHVQLQQPVHEATEGVWNVDAEGAEGDVQDAGSDQPER